MGVLPAPQVQRHEAGEEEHVLGVIRRHPVACVDAACTYVDWGRRGVGRKKRPDKLTLYATTSNTRGVETAFTATGNQ